MDKALKKYLKNGQFQGVTEARSRQMASVRGKGNKSTEKKLRYALVGAGISGWRVQPRGISGNPDFIFDQEMLAVFVDGCYWHGCPRCGHIPKTRSDFWEAKIARTKARDKEKECQLKLAGYAVLRFWEHDLKESLSECVDQINFIIQKKKTKK